jgi:hypothetical protein
MNPLKKVIRNDSLHRTIFLFLQYRLLYKLESKGSYINIYRSQGTTTKSIDRNQIEMLYDNTLEGIDLVLHITLS